MNKESNTVERKKLMELTGGACTPRVIYIQAPAGYGKTVFAGHWLETQKRPRARVTLDAYDNTLFDLCCKLKQALEDLYPDEASVLAYTRHPAFGSAPEEFLMRAAGSLPKTAPASLVIDDLHYIEDPQVQRILPVFLMRLPENTKILLLSRTAPPEAFSGLILKNELLLIAQELMCFDVDEICTLYRNNHVGITRQDAETILRYTEGWPIEINAVLISGLSLSGANISSVRVSPDQFENFLNTQVWETWDEASRTFMVATSIEEELTEDLCNYLTGKTDSKSILEQLLANGSFLIRHENGSYRFHKLFREFLQKQFEGCPRKYQNQQYRLAGSYYFDHQDFYRAIERYSHMGDIDEIARCFDLLEYMERSDFDTEQVMAVVRNYINEEIAERYPFLYLLMAFTARNDGDIDDFIRYAEGYYTNYSRVVERNPNFRHNIFFLYMLDFRYTLTDIALAASKIRADFKGVRGSSTSYFPFYHRSFRDFSELALSNIDEGVTAMSGTLGALLGDEMEMLAATVSAGLHYERGELTRAKELILSAAVKIQNGFTPESKFCVLMMLMAVNRVMNPSEGVSAISREIQAMIDEDKAYYLQFNFDAVLTKYRLSGGDTAAAQAWLNANDTGIHSQVSFFRLYGLFTTARAHITVGNFEKAVILLQKIEALCSAMKRPLDVIEAEILLAICYWKKKRGYQKQAMAHLEKAVETAGPYDYVQLFIDEGAELESMLSRLKSRTARSDYTGALSGAFVKKLYLGAAQQSIHSKGLTGGRVERSVRFTQQQKRVMKLLCEGCSYREIGETLGIQFSTVRSHIELIYKKLDVSGAKEAILKIQELKVLEDD